MNQTPFHRALTEEARAILKMRNASNHEKKASTKEGRGRNFHLQAARARKQLALGHLKTANALMKQALVENYSKMLNRTGLPWAKKLEGLEASYKKQIDDHMRNVGRFYPHESNKFQTIGSKALGIIGRWREDQNFRNTTRETNNLLKKTENVLKLGRNAIAETQGRPKQFRNPIRKWFAGLKNRLSKNNADSESHPRTPSRNNTTTDVALRHNSTTGRTPSPGNNTNTTTDVALRHNSTRRRTPSSPQTNKTLFKRALEAEARALPLFQIAKNRGNAKKHKKQAQDLMKRALNENYARSPGPNLESSYRKQIANHMTISKELYGNASSNIGNQILNNLKQRRMKPSPFAFNGINRSLNRTPQPYRLLGKNIIQNNLRRR